MKNRILTFIIGVLVGAIITTIGFYIYEKTGVNKNNPMQNGNKQQMMQQDGNMVNPPEKPSGEERTLPDMPSGDMGNFVNMQDQENNS